MNKPLLMNMNKETSVQRQGFFAEFCPECRCNFVFSLEAAEIPYLTSHRLTPVRCSLETVKGDRLRGMNKNKL
jgi:hypothetical protein